MCVGLGKKKKKVCVLMVIKEYVTQYSSNNGALWHRGAISGFDNTSQIHSLLVQVYHHPYPLKL